MILPVNFKGSAIKKRPSSFFYGMLFSSVFTKHVLWIKKKRTAAEAKAILGENKTQAIAGKRSSLGRLTKATGRLVAISGTNGMTLMADQKKIPRRKEQTVSKHR